MESANDGTVHVDASIVVPVNAQGDIGHALTLLGDLERYRGPHRLEMVLVVNNFPPGEPPTAVGDLEAMGARVLAMADVRRAGHSVGIVARMHGLRAARGEPAILFDADCRIPNPTALIDWYVGAFRDGAGAAYTRVGHFDLPPGFTVRLRVFMHHGGRWVKRTLLRVPTIRGSNYAVLKGLFLRLYDEGLIVHDMNVGPAVKATGARIAYSGSKELTVLTSGRMVRGGWLRLLRFIPKRIKYNARTLPVRPMSHSPGPPAKRLDD